MMPKPVVPYAEAAPSEKELLFLAKNADKLESAARGIKRIAMDMNDVKTGNTLKAYTEVILSVRTDLVKNYNATQLPDAQRMILREKDLDIP